MQPLSQVHLTPLAYSVGHWLARPNAEEWIDLNAPYQRGSVWTDGQRVALIKSLYMGVPVGSIITSVLWHDPSNSHHIRVVDGKQRIETVRAWAAGSLPVPGWWFRDDDIAERADLVTYRQLSECGRRQFEMSSHLPALEFDGRMEWQGRDKAGKAIRRRRSPDELLRAEAELYGLINGGGTAQSEADMDRAAKIASR